VYLSDTLGLFAIADTLNGGLVSAKFKLPAKRKKRFQYLCKSRIYRNWKLASKTKRKQKKKSTKQKMKKWYVSSHILSLIEAVWGA